MLILMRRPGESIMIGEDVVVTVLEVRGHQVKIGVKAPKNLPVDREEVRERQAQEKAAHAAA